MIAESVPSASIPSPRLQLSDEVARRYSARIRRHAARVARRLPRHIQVSDLVSAGYTGLVDAYLRFDTARMESFEAYVDQRIRGAILDELREHDPLTRDQRAFSRKLATTTHRLATELGRAPEESEVAEALGLSLDALQVQLSRMCATAARNGAASLDEDADEAIGEAWDRPDEIAERSEQFARISSAIEALPPRHRHVLRMHYEEGKTLRQIGEALGVTESRASQIHAEAIGRLRALVGEG